MKRERRQVWPSRMGERRERPNTTGNRIEPNSVVTTALPRLGLITCSTATVVTNTHSHQFLPLTRTEVSSEQTNRPSGG